MTDICFSPSAPLPSGWDVLFSTPYRQLSMRECDGTRPCRAECRGGIVVAVCSESLTPQECMARIHQKGIAFPYMADVAAGIVWNTNSGEYAVFRDNFGFIPILGTHRGDAVLYTTCPDLHAQWHAHSKPNRRMSAHFLRCEDSTSTEDFWEEAFRVRPGDVVYCTQGDPAQFLRECALLWNAPDARPEPTPGMHYHYIWREPDTRPEDPAPGVHYHYIYRRNFWENRRYVARADHDAAGIRAHLAEAVDRIGAPDLCFTLSGGLDSTSVLSSWCKKHPGRVRAVSLISRLHPSCDESAQLDILERAFPIDLTRVNMDVAWPLSEPALYRRTRGYGPVCRPGMESLLAAFRAAAPGATMVTGYGGNVLVGVRAEALWGHILRHASPRVWLRELCAMSPTDVRFLLHRVIGNAAGGRIRAALRSPSDPAPWLEPSLSAQFAPAATDPVCRMSHGEERTYLPLTWEWEMRMRSLAAVCRASGRPLVDPLFDLDLYDYCACIPPHVMEPCGRYRAAYREALAPLLPTAILEHPKTQHFDEILLDGVFDHGAAIVLDALSDCGGLLDAAALRRAYEDSRRRRALPDALWRAIATCLWHGAP